MINEVGVHQLFGDNKKARRAFYDWCKASGEFCEYDLEILGMELGVPFCNNTEKYVHFHKGNLIDWLEQQGYFITMKISNSLKYAPVVYHTQGSNRPFPFYHNAGMNSRIKAWEKAIEKAIDHLEQNLK